MSSLAAFIQDLLGGILICTVTIGVVYAIFNRGLAFRIYAVVMPLLTWTTVGTRLMERVTAGTFEYLFIVLLTFVVNIASLTFLYRITVKPLREYAVNLESSSAQLAATASQSAGTATQQSSMAAEMGTTVEEISQTSTSAAQRAEEIVEVAASALDYSRDGQAAIHDALEVMIQIGRVNKIVDSVNKLAEKSNLLAVNASIEAAKAGEHGRGFAVVATEVRNLAEQSAEATEEIRDALELTSLGRSSIETANKVIERLAKVLEDASDRSRQIASASVQQAAGIKQINDAANTLSQTSQDSASATRQIDQASANLSGIGAQLRRFIGGRGKK